MLTLMRPSGSQMSPKSDMKVQSSLLTCSGTCQYSVPTSVNSDAQLRRSSDRVCSVRPCPKAARCRLLLPSPRADMVSVINIISPDNLVPVLSLERRLPPNVFGDAGGSAPCAGVAHLTNDGEECLDMLCVLVFSLCIVPMEGSPVMGASERSPPEVCGRMPKLTPPPIRSARTSTWMVVMAPAIACNAEAMVRVSRSVS
mmetsp:Transcript_36662/g.84350  ORF Transcript_36662/g.84350 Transcript_36662/m.84350 type:complete len:200 (+) Transcript_36662:1207-1806(+)